jgi:dCTP diphosphatase
MGRAPDPPPGGVTLLVPNRSLWRWSRRPGVGIGLTPVNERSAWSIADLQERLATFRDARDWSQFHTPRNLAAAIAVEAGELQELFLWSHHGAEILDSRRRDVEHELADVVIQALNFANAAGIDAATAIRAKIELNDERYPVDKARGTATKWSEL